MAGGSLLLLLDDIAAILDDVAVMTKTAASKTAGVLGDDLALNAQQVTGVVAKRELPVVWAVCKGSFLNKLILVPCALLISWLAPWLVTPLLMVGGLYLCFEGCEKLFHVWYARRQHTVEEASAKLKALEAGVVDEQAKIKGAVRTDFILSAEIIAITLGVVSNEVFMTRVLVLSLIAVVMTAGVYGLVAGIVKLDDLGLYLSKKDSSAARGLGVVILRAAPYLMKLLSVVGTAAMFLVGGGILAHGVPVVHHWVEYVGAQVGGGWWGMLATSGLNGVIGLIAGGVALVIFKLIRRGKAGH